MTHSFIPVPKAARVELIYSHLGVTMENVFNVTKGSNYTLAQLQALRGVVDTWDSTQWAATRVVGCTLTRIRTRALDSASSPTEDYYLPTPRAGGDGTGPLPGNVTYAIKLSTGLAGRSYRGRWFFVGMGYGALSGANNQLSTAARNSWVTRLNALITALSGAGHTLVVVSYRQNKTWLTEGVATPVSNFVAVDLNIDSMRRRLTGRGT